MRKFKLVKKYPNSPPIGTVLKMDSDGKWLQGAGLTLSEIIHYNDFWEEVVEKDYKILSIRGGGYLTLNLIGNNYTDSRLINHPIEKLDFLLDPIIGGYHIHSVKRLSDEEIFTIGDKLEVYGLIQSIHILNTHNTITFGVTNDDEDIWLEDAKKAKQSLFITEDGVGVFEGDGDLFSVLTKGTWETRRSKPTNYLVNEKVQYWKHFKTKEAREEYIIMNKPCLSIKEVLEAANVYKIPHRLALQELVKNKSNL